MWRAANGDRDRRASAGCAPRLPDRVPRLHCVLDIQSHSSLVPNTLLSAGALCGIGRAVHHPRPSTHGKHRRGPRGMRFHHNHIPILHSIGTLPLLETQAISPRYRTPKKDGCVWKRANADDGAKFEEKPAHAYGGENITLLTSSLAHYIMVHAVSRPRLCALCLF